MALTTLLHRQPGQPWGWYDHAMVGNGRLGATLAGQVHTELVRLNEHSIWSRSPAEHYSDASRSQLEPVRQMLLEGRLDEAEFLVESGIMGQVNRVQPYEPLGMLKIGHAHPTRAQAGDVTDYRRTLELETGLAGVSFEFNGHQYTRELFASYPDQVMAMRFTTDHPEGLSLWMGCWRPANFVSLAQDDLLRVTGRAGEHGTRFESQIRVLPEGGTVEAIGSRLVVRHANSVVWLIAAETDYWEDFRREAVQQPYGARAKTRLDAAAELGYEALRARHLTDHRSLMDRATLSLGADDLEFDVAAEQEAAEQGEVSSAFYVTQYRFARYVNVASSREGLPNNLQGLWNDQMAPPWNSDYHTNINIQMNYWPVESGGLGETHRPFLDWLEFIAEHGRVTAQKQYGCRGWVLHHVSTPWGFTLPADSATDGLWPVGGAWCALHLWEHYLHHGDQSWLTQHGYPLMRDAALFFQDYCFMGEDGLLHTGPSTSPENLYRTASGTVGKICLSPTMDHQIIRELLMCCLAAAQTLDVDADQQAVWTDMLAKLRPTRIGPHGGIAEWAEDYDEIEPGHRHMSHLFGLHPGTQISLDATPDLAEAVKKTIARRLAHQQIGGEAGWSAAWKCCFYARLHDREAALEALHQHASKLTLPNMFGKAHNVLQFDSTAGCGAGIAEMLLQSHETQDGVRVIRLLPALPESWSQGRLEGFVARGGHRLSVNWQDGAIHSAQFTFGFEPSAVVVGPSGRVELAGQPGEIVELAGI